MDTGSLQSRDDNGHHSSTGTSAGTPSHESPQDKVFHNTSQSSQPNKCRHRSHAHTLRHSHTGICAGSSGRRNPEDTFDHSVVPCSPLHNDTGQSQGHSCPRCSCSHTGWHSSAPIVQPHKLLRSWVPSSHLYKHRGQSHGGISLRFDRSSATGSSGQSAHLDRHSDRDFP